jgi:uncharacterized Zn-finger protein
MMDVEDLFISQFDLLANEINEINSNELIQEESKEANWILVPINKPEGILFVRKYPCNKCDKAFNTLFEIKSHLVKHSNERPFNCTICRTKFKRKDALVKHMQSIHTYSEILLECEICGKLVRHQSTLRNHMRSHSNIRDFKCQMCNKSFKRRDHLKEHLLTHNTYSAFKCVLCNKRYKLEKYLRRHMKDSHYPVNIRQ